MNKKQKRGRGRPRKDILSQEQLLELSVREHEAKLQRRHSRDGKLKDGHIIVYPFDEWCEMRSISEPTGRRLIKQGLLKTTQMSERRFGIRSDHDLEFLNSRLRVVGP